MSTIPILFSGPMVRAIIDGSKTQTRRVVKPQPGWTEEVTHAEMFNSPMAWPIGSLGQQCGWPIKPKYQSGNILWVRETWREWDSGLCGCGGDVCHCPSDGTPIYAADEPHKLTRDECGPWRPSIFMPRKHCRLFLRVTDVRLQRLQEISEEDAYDEGAAEWAAENPPKGADKYRNITLAFRALWDSINAKRGFGWDANPWVWAYTFKRIAKPEGWPEVS